MKQIFLAFFIVILLVLVAMYFFGRSKCSANNMNFTNPLVDPSLNDFVDSVNSDCKQGLNPIIKGFNEIF